MRCASERKKARGKSPLKSSAPSRGRSIVALGFFHGLLSPIFVRSAPLPHRRALWEINKPPSGDIFIIEKPSVLPRAFRLLVFHDDVVEVEAEVAGKGGIEVGLGHRAADAVFIVSVGCAGVFVVDRNRSGAGGVIILYTKSEPADELVGDLDYGRISRIIRVLFVDAGLNAIVAAIELDIHREEVTATSGQEYLEDIGGAIELGDIDSCFKYSLAAALSVRVKVDVVTCGGAGLGDDLEYLIRSIGGVCRDGDRVTGFGILLDIQTGYGFITD